MLQESMESKLNENARVIAFYLPQFHPTAINDEWWGKGFTEWTNVGKAKPLFKGHDQPRVPADLGYYDLRLPEVREAQVQLAKESGVEGFMYWHYWFGNGKRALEMPYNALLESKKPDFPFCLGWANHSWKTDSWNVHKSFKTVNTLFDQVYPGKEDFIEHFNVVLPAFLDNRYIKVDGKPIFVVYSPMEVENCDQFIEIWNKMAIESGLPGVYFIGVNKGWNNHTEQILGLGFDAVNRQGQWEAECAVKGKLGRTLIGKLSKYAEALNLERYSYKDIIKHMMSEDDKKENVFPTIVPQWDRSPRSGKKAVIYTGSTPDLFETHISQAIEIVKEKPIEKRIVFLKSWNEWGEGNYVEPDITNGHGYLNALKNMLLKNK